MLTFANQQRILAEILKRPSNSNCADCNAISPTWASLDFGVFICPNCSGAHRSLGPTITRVKSTKLDSWHPDWVNNMQVGNKEVNNFWESKLTAKKPNSQATLDQLKKYVVDKYIRKKYVGTGEDPLTCHKNGTLNKYKQETNLKIQQKNQSKLNKAEVKSIPETKKQKSKDNVDIFSFQEPIKFYTPPHIEEEQEFGNYTESTPTNGPQTTISTTQCITFNDLLSINQSQKVPQPHPMFQGGYNQIHQQYQQQYYQHQINLHSHNHMGYSHNLPYLHKSQSESHNQQYHSYNPYQNMYPQGNYHHYQQINIPTNLKKQLSSQSSNHWQR